MESSLVTRQSTRSTRYWYPRYVVHHLNLCMVSYRPCIGLLVEVEMILIFIPEYYKCLTCIGKFDLYCCSKKERKMRQQLCLDHGEINGPNISTKIVNKPFPFRMFISQPNIVKVILQYKIFAPILIATNCRQKLSLSSLSQF